MNRQYLIPLVLEAQGRTEKDSKGLLSVTHWGQGEWRWPHRPGFAITLALNFV